MEELLRIVNEIEAQNEGELVEALKAAEISDETIEVAKTVARLISAHSENFGPDQFELIGKSLGFVEEESGEEITKSELEKLPASLRKKVEGLQKELDDNAEVVKGLVDRLDKKEADERRQSFVEKVEGIELGIPTEELADLVKSVADNNEEAADKLVTALKSASALAEGSEIFTEEGSSGEGTATDDAYGQIRKIALAKQEADSSLTYPKALESAMAENPELKKAYLAEARG